MQHILIKQTTASLVMTSVPGKCHFGTVDHVIVTFTGTDHLQHHLSCATGVQPRLLVQDLLLFHLFFLSNKHTHSVSYKLHPRIHVTIAIALPQTFSLFLLPLLPPHPLRSSEDAKVNFENIVLVVLREIWIYEINYTFAIMSAYAIYKGSSSK